MKRDAKPLRTAKRIMTDAGLVIVAVSHGGRHALLRCRHEESGREGVIAVHYGSRVKSCFAAGMRAAARSVARGGYAPAKG